MYIHIFWKWSFMFNHMKALRCSVFSPSAAGSATSCWIRLRARPPQSRAQGGGDRRGWFPKVSVLEELSYIVTSIWTLLWVECCSTWQWIDVMYKVPREMEVWVDWRVTHSCKPSETKLWIAWLSGRKPLPLHAEALRFCEVHPRDVRKFWCDSHCVHICPNTPLTDPHTHACRQTPTSLRVNKHLVHSPSPHPSPPQPTLPRPSQETNGLIIKPSNRKQNAETNWALVMLPNATFNYKASGC